MPAQWCGTFVKNEIHNGIEYGLMQAYAEGFDILRNTYPLPADSVMISTLPISPRSGGAAALSPRGYST